MKAILVITRYFLKKDVQNEKAYRLLTSSPFRTVLPFLQNFQDDSNGLGVKFTHQSGAQVYVYKTESGSIAVKVEGRESEKVFSDLEEILKISLSKRRASI